MPSFRMRGSAAHPSAPTGRCVWRETVTAPTIAPRHGPDRRHRRARLVVRHPGWPAPERPRAGGRQQERRPADPRRLPADERAGRAPQRAADPRRRDDDGPARRRRRGGRVERPERGAGARGRDRDARARRRAGQPDPRVVPARRPAAGPPRASQRPASRRRCDRPPPARPTHPAPRSRSAPATSCTGRFAAGTSSSTRRA